MLFCFGFAKILGSVSLEFSSYLKNLESLFLPISIVLLSYNHLHFIFFTCVYVYFTFIFCPKANWCSFSFESFSCFILNSLLLLCSEVHGYFLWCPICLLFHPVYFFISYTVGLFIQYVLNLLKLWNFKVATCVCMSNHMLAHMFGIHCHMCASFTTGCTFVYFTVQYYIEYSIFISSPGCPKESVKAVVM